jgi:hypothetical protein
MSDFFKARAEAVDDDSDDDMPGLEEEDEVVAVETARPEGGGEGKGIASEVPAAFASSKAPIVWGDKSSGVAGWAAKLQVRNAIAA